MTAEFEKLAQEQKARGDVTGYNQTMAMIRSLYTSGLMDVSQEKSLPADQGLPPFEFTKPEKVSPSRNISWTIHEIDALNISSRARNGIVRVGITTIRQLYNTPDDEIMEIRNLGKKSLIEIRIALRMFKNKILAEREKHAIFDDTPVVFPFPSGTINKVNY